MRKIYITPVLVLIALMACRKDQTKTTAEPCEPVIITYDDLERYWVLTHKIRIVDDVKIKEEQGSYSTYPITLEFVQNDSIKGNHDINSYRGVYIKTERNMIDFSKLFSTDALTGPWFSDYTKELDSVGFYEVRSEHTLRLFTKEETLSLYFLDKSKFEEMYFKLDTVY